MSLFKLSLSSSNSYLPSYGTRFSVSKTPLLHEPEQKWLVFHWKKITHSLLDSAAYTAFTQINILWQPPYWMLLKNSVYSLANFQFFPCFASLNSHGAKLFFPPCTVCFSHCSFHNISIPYTIHIYQISNSVWQNFPSICVEQILSSPQRSAYVRCGAVAEKYSAMHINSRVMNINQIMHVEETMCRRAL